MAPPPILLVTHAAFAATAWLIGLGVEKLGASPVARTRVWAAALLAAAAIAPGIWLVDILNVPTPWPAAAAERQVALPAQPSAVPIQAPSLQSFPKADIAAKSQVSITARIFEAIGVVLLLGFAVRLAGLAVRRRSLKRLVAASRPFDNPLVIDRVNTAADRLGVSAPQVRLSAVTAPLVIRTPRVILLPQALADRLATDRIALICGHEIAHLKRGDDWAMWGEEVLLALFWFNPIMAGIGRRLSAAREEVCDQLALGDAGRQDRQAYAETLVSSFKLCSTMPVGLAFVGLHSNQARQRLVAILAPPRRSRVKTVFAAGVAVVLLGAAGGVSLAFADGPRPDPWLKPDRYSGLTDADKAWLAMRRLEIDIENQERFSDRAPNPARMREIVSQSRAQVEAIRARIEGKPISELARSNDRDAVAARDAEWALVAQWDGPASTGKVRATMYCPHGEPCVVKALSPEPSARDRNYGDWAQRYAETFRQRFVIDWAPYGMIEDGALIRTDLSPEILASAPNPRNYREFFVGSGPRGLPLTVGPPP